MEAWIVDPSTPGTAAADIAGSLTMALLPSCLLEPVYSLTQWAQGSETDTVTLQC